MKQPRYRKSICYGSREHTVEVGEWLYWTRVNEYIYKRLNEEQNVEIEITHFQQSYKRQDQSILAIWKSCNLRKKRFVSKQCVSRHVFWKMNEWLTAVQLEVQSLVKSMNRHCTVDDTYNCRRDGSSERKTSNGEWTHIIRNISTEKSYPQSKSSIQNIQVCAKLGHETNHNYWNCKIGRLFRI